MDIDWENPRQVAVLFSVVVATTVVASFGFYTLTGNPGLPDMSASISIEDGLAVEQSGTVDVFTIKHTGGESVPLSELRVVIGSRAAGLTFGAGSNWTASTPDLTYQLRYNGHNSTTGSAFSPGDRLTLTKVSGTLNTPEIVNVTVRLFYEPSQQAIESWKVTFEESPGEP